MADGTGEETSTTGGEGVEVAADTAGESSATGGEGRNVGVVIDGKMQARLARIKTMETGTDFFIIFISRMYEFGNFTTCYIRSTILDETCQAGIRQISAWEAIQGR